MVSDLSGVEGEVETVGFGLDGVSFEIDLTAEEAQTLRDDLKLYTDAGRKLGRSGKAVKNVRVGPDPKAVRAWAEANGIPVPARGRLPHDLVEKFEAAES
jgi:hypothetical protein